MAELTFTYRFILDEDREEMFRVRLDSHTLDPVDELETPLPNWTRLEFHQCAHCPLNSDTHPHCPLAARIVHVVRRFENVVSYQDLRVVSQTAERTVTQRTTAQEAISSLMGLIMATSGCPHTTYFKPMARFHLPLATGEETMYRASSMYLLAQYFIQKEGGRPDLALDGLREIYANVQQLNSAMADRIREAIQQDAAVNALVILDFFAMRFSFEVEDHLANISHLFAPYVTRADGGVA